MPDWLITTLFILAIVVGAFIVSRTTRWVVRRVIRRVFSPGARRFVRRATPAAFFPSGESNQRVEARLDALSTVFRSLVSVVVWSVALVWILRLLGVNAATLLASAGIIGVALGIGAQNVVRDFLAGFFILVEDQFGVGDVVDLGNDVKGTVEIVTLRATHVRDVHGTLWHVPNGQIVRAANKTQQWARALLDIEVDIDTDYDVAQQVIADTATGLANDDAWQDDIVDAPEVWGIEAFTAEGYTIRLVVKTQPNAQFAVMRELRIRLLAAFDIAGIRFPCMRPELWVHRGGDEGVRPPRVPSTPHERVVRGDSTEAD